MANPNAPPPPTSLATATPLVCYTATATVEQCSVHDIHHQSNTSNHVSSTNQSLHADVRAVAITTISPSSICPIASQQLATVKRKRGQFKRFSHKVIEWIRKSLALGRNEVLFSSLLSPTNAMCIFVCCVCVPNFSFCNLWLSLFFRNIFVVVSVLFCCLLAFVLWSLQPMYIDDRVDFFFPAEILFWIQSFICSYGAKPYGNRHTENIFIPLIAIRGEWIRTKNSHFRNHTFFSLFHSIHCCSCCLARKLQKPKW